MSKTQGGSLITGVGVLVVALIAVLGDTSLAVPIKTALAGTSPLLASVIVYAVHALEGQSVQAGATVSAARNSTAVDIGAVSDQVLTKLAAQFGGPLAAALQDQAPHAPAAPSGPVTPDGKFRWNGTGWEPNVV